MQDQETPMDDMDEKAVVRIDAEGAVVKCAKGVTDGCGYKAGAKVCGKCGAMAVQVKGDDVDMTEDYEGMGDEMPKKQKPKRGRSMGNPQELDGYDEEDPSAEAMDESDEVPDESNGEMGETLVEAMSEPDVRRRMAARKRRMASMNVKSAEWGDDAYLCGLQMKMLSGDSQPCAACPGGCAPESDLPTLLEVQGLAEQISGGKVLSSGYSDAVDLYIVDVEQKDGRLSEMYFDGATAECIRWEKLDEALIGEKSAQLPMAIVSIDEAAQIATKSLPGEVVAVDADVFEGYDVYAVEIEGADGKSYDGFVSLNGELLGYDEYDPTEAADIDAETSEYALKAAYSTVQRERMAETGEAMEDGSYPIKNMEDLKNAIQAYGRAKNKPAARIHIRRRAEDLDAIDMIPENWLSGKEADAEEKAEFDPKFLASLMEFELLATEEDRD
jgi:uncharacterized membrane protein YkoI